MNKLLILLLATLGSTAYANAPKVGRNAAAKYFQANNQSSNNQQDNEEQSNRYPSSIDSLKDDEHYLAIGIGSFTQTDSYNWGQSTKEEDVGKYGIDMTYRLAQEGYLFDQALRVSYNEFKPAGERTSKLSFMYGMTLPDAGSKFPLYFGTISPPWSIRAWTAPNAIPCPLWSS